MDQINKNIEKFGTNEKLSLGGKLDGKLPISGRYSLSEKLSFGRVSATELPSLGRQSLINSNFQFQPPLTRSKTSLLPKEIEENSKNLKNFILKQAIFPIDPLFEKKQFNYATEGNFLEYLQIIVWHIDKNYECTNLQEDLNFFLNLFDLEPLQETTFKNITNNWKYVVDGYVKLIKIIEYHYEIFKIDNYDEDNFLNYFNDPQMYGMLSKTIQNMGLEDDCKEEHYSDVLKCYIENYDSINLTNINNLDHLIRKVESLRRKKKEYENLYKEFETESHKLDLINKEIESLKNTLILNDSQFANIKEELSKKMSWIESKNNEIAKINNEWIVTKEKINNQSLSKEKAQELCTSTEIISNRIDGLEDEIKNLKKIYNEKYDEVSEVLKTVDIKSRCFVERLIKVSKNIDKSAMIEDINYKYLDISGDLNQTLNYYKNNPSFMIENLIETSNKLLLLKEEIFSNLKNTIRNMISDCESVIKIHTDLKCNYYNV